MIPSNAIKDLQWFTKKVAGIVELVPFLEELAALEVSIQEKTELAKQLAGEYEVQKQKVQSAKDEFLKTKTEVDRILEQAKTQAKDIVSVAAEDAAKLIRAKKEPLEGEISILKEEITNLHASKEAEHSRLTDLHEEVKTAQNRLDSIRAELAKLRNSI